MGLLFKVEDGWTGSFLTFLVPNRVLFVTLGHGFHVFWGFHTFNSLDSISCAGLCPGFIF